jgi:hypothetical protein
MSAFDPSTLTRAQWRTLVTLGERGKRGTASIGDEINARSADALRDRGLVTIREYGAMAGCSSHVEHHGDRGATLAFKGYAQVFKLSSAIGRGLRAVSS